jgi:uncharacterized protein YecE (DUF72 family)
MARLWIGTSGWVYKHWRKGVFYPGNLSQRDELGYYADVFDTVELNNSFYHLPKRATFAGWKGQTPSAFTFAVKASRYLTHMRKLQEPAEPLQRLITAARGLGPKLGPVLFQFPASWQSNPQRLSEFMQALGRYRSPRWAFEFRHKSWLREEIFETLAAGGAALCIPVAPGMPLELRKTTDWTYIRFHHGKAGVGYSGQELAVWSKRIRDFLDSGADVYAYFNNDSGGHAIRDAQRLRVMLAEEE